MLRSVTLALLLLPLGATAQPFPEPGTGAWDWQTLGDELVNARELVFTEAGDLLALDTELYRYDFGAERWTHNDDLPNVVGAMRSALALGGDTLIAGRFLSRSPDGGQTWEVPCYDDGVTCTRLSVDATSHAIHEVTTGPYAGRLLAGAALYSDDRGGSWTTAEIDVVEDGWGFKMHDFAPLPSGRILGAGHYGAGVTDDGGESWTTTELFAPYGIQAEAIAEWATPGSVQAHAAGGPAPSCGLADAALCEGAVVIGNHGAEHLRAWWTNDGGRSWSEGSLLPQIYDGPGGNRAAMLTELDRAGTDGAGGGGAGRGLAIMGRGFVFRTLDGGVTWDLIARVPDIGLGESQIALSAEVGPDGRLYVTVPRNGPSDEYVYVTEGQASDGLSYVVDAADGAPAREGLGVRVVPNPSSSGAVTVELSGDGAARASVVDAQGRVVAELFAGELRGGRTVELDTSAWAAGVYTVVVEAGGERTAEAFTVAR